MIIIFHVLCRKIFRCVVFFFFFQAEDGIRDFHVTGVQTCALPIAASKVFCADDDIVRYSATVNPLDWSSSDDAGYLPTGLQNYGANPVEAMGLYRGNLVVFNAEAFQLWQVDEDPASMALLDALPMGSTQHHAMAPVSNDLFFLASQGVR